MKFSLMHPKDQLIMIMQRIYGFGMTTTSGGNLSILDETGDMWITPAGIDKGSLRAEDMICVKKDGSIVGNHKPSSEYPFHLAIYKKRKDIKAILHAHPSALVAFSIIRKIPNTRIIPQALDVCGVVGYAPYALPGSAELGERIAKAFEEGNDTILLENHGIVTGGPDLFSAFKRFETLDFCARIIIRGSALGEYSSLNDEQISLFNNRNNKLYEFKPELHSSAEKELRKKICEFVKRAYDHKLMTSTEGTLSARVGKNSFLITSYGVDRKYIDPSDLVLIENGKCEKGKIPSRSVRLHLSIYDSHPEINSILTAQPPNIMAYGITGKSFDSKTIPESYIVLRQIPLVEYGPQFNDLTKLNKLISPDTPVILLKNDALLTTGSTLLQAYDRLEVAEFTAAALLNTLTIGNLVPINKEQVDELDKVFLGK